MKKNFVVMAFTALILGLCCMSCEKEEFEKIDTNNNSKASLEMRVFEDVAALNDEVTKTTQMSFEELVEYEKSIGFSSFGKTSEQYLYPIVEKSEELSYEQLCDLVNEHSEHLQLKDIDEDIDFDVKYANSPFRYVMNQNRMVRAGETLYKIFENGFVTCNIQYYGKLLSMTEQDFEKLAGNDSEFTIYRAITSSKDFGQQNLQKNKVSPDGKYKIFYTATYVPGLYVNNNEDLDNAKYHTISKVKKRTLGVYWPHRFAITNNVTYKFWVVGNLIQKIDNKSTGSINPPYKLENDLKIGLVHRKDHSTDVHIKSAWGGISNSMVSLEISEQ